MSAIGTADVCRAFGTLNIAFVDPPVETGGYKNAAATRLLVHQLY